MFRELLSKEQLFTFLLCNKRQDVRTRIAPPIMKECFIKPFLIFEDCIRERKHAKLEELIELIKNNPAILRNKYKITNKNHTYESITIYEYFLGEADFPFCLKLEECFQFLEDGEKLREEQSKGYQAALEKSYAQQSYDFETLIKILKNSSPQDIEEELKLDDYDASYISDLRRELENFRRHLSIPNNKVHYNFANLILAYKIMDTFLESDDYNNNIKRAQLFWCQIIGTLQKYLPVFVCQVLCGGQMLGSKFLRPESGVFHSTSLDLKFQTDQDETESENKNEQTINDTSGKGFISEEAVIQEEALDIKDESEEECEFGIAYPTKFDDERKGLGYSFAIGLDGIPSKFCFDVTKDTLYYVMEYLRGQYGVFSEEAKSSDSKLINNSKKRKR